MTTIYGMLECSSKSRICRNGIPFRPYHYLDQKNHVINSKKYTETHTDMWVKVIQKNTVTFELSEVIGPVCYYEHELTLLRKVYNVYWKYPIVTTPRQQIQSNQVDFYAFTVDGETTVDRDDAISIETKDDTVVIGVHITDVTNYPELFSFSKHIVSSAYWDTGCRHMLPPDLSLSLDKGRAYPCVSLQLTYSKQGLVLIDTVLLPSTSVFITDNFTYENFSPDPVLSTISGTTETTDIIAFFMVQYNLYIAKNVPGILLRVQETPETRAYYSYELQAHSHFGELYAHGTSPMRRFADLCNQYMIKGKPVEDVDIESVNRRMTEIAQFHYHETVMSMAYQCKDTPIRVLAVVRVIEDDKMIQVTLPMGKKVKIPLSDTFYAEPVCEQLKLCTDQTIDIELFGIHKHGKAMLRVSLL